MTWYTESVDTFLVCLWSFCQMNPKHFVFRWIFLPTNQVKISEGSCCEVNNEVVVPPASQPNLQVGKMDSVVRVFMYMYVKGRASCDIMHVWEVLVGECFLALWCHIILPVKPIHWKCCTWFQWITASKYVSETWQFSGEADCSLWLRWIIRRWRWHHAEHCSLGWCSSGLQFFSHLIFFYM